MKTGKIAKMALAVLSIMTISATGASLAACGKKHRHSYGEWAIVETQKPTLEEGGLAERFCTSDDGGRDTVEVPRLTDTSVWTEGTAVDPTHTTDGSRTFTSDYGTVTVTVPKNADAHTYSWTFSDGKTPDLENGGEIAGICGGDSSHTTTKSVPALSDGTFWTKNVTTPPTHQTEGVADFTNAEYGISVTGVAIPKENHVFGAWEITVEPTLTAAGKAVRVCTNDGCAEDPSATAELPLPALTDTTFWIKGEHVEQDYNHPESDTYTNAENDIVYKHITKPKLAVVYDGKTYHSINFAINDNGKVSVTTSWVNAELNVNADSIGFGTAHPFNGKLVFELVDYETGLVKITKYNKISTGSGTGSEEEEEWGESEYSLREASEYNDVADAVYYAYVDMTTGILVLQNYNNWNSINVAVPTASVLSDGDFAVSACRGDFVIGYTVNGAPFNMLVMGTDGTVFDVTVTDINGFALNAGTCFDASDVVIIKDKTGKVVKAYARNGENEWVVADGLQGTYKNGADVIVVNGAAGVKVNGADYTYEIVSDTAESKVIGVIAGNVYYEYTLTGDGASAAGGVYTVETPKVTVTYNLKGVTPTVAITAETDISKKVPIELAVPENDAMQFIGWYTDENCTTKVTLEGGKYIPENTVTLYAKWATKVAVTIEDAIGGARVIYTGEGEHFGSVVNIYTKNQVDEVSKKYFAGWYTKQGDRLISDTDEIDGNITIYAKWENVHVCYGEYTGKQLLAAGTVKVAALTVSATGEVTGAVDGKAIDGEIKSYNPETQVVIWEPKSDRTKTYTMWFDAESGLFIIPADFGNTVMDTSPFIVSADGLVGENTAIRYSLTGAAESGKNKLIEYGNGKLAVMYENHIYSDVTLTDVFGAQLTFETAMTSKTLIVKQGKEEVFAIGATGNTLNDRKDEFGNKAEIIALDEYRGVYNVGGDEFRLDGLGNVTWGESAGIYEFLKKDGETDVFGVYERIKHTDVSSSEDDDGEVTTVTTVTYTTVAYYELRLGATNSFEKPMVTISFNSAQTAVADTSVNMHIAYTPADLANTSTHVFRGWYLDSAFDEAVGEAYAPAADVTFYAKWLEKVTLTVDYKDDGEDGGSRTETFEYGKGETVEIADPERTGYKFDGWYVDETTPFEETVINADTTVIAKWKVAGNYVHIYNVISVSGTNSSGTGSLDFRNTSTITFKANGTSTSNSWPFNGSETTITEYNDETGVMLIDTKSTQAGIGVHRAVNDLEKGVIVFNYPAGADADFARLFILIPETSASADIADWSESYWNGGKSRAISFKWRNEFYTVFVHANNVYFNVSFKNAADAAVAADAAYRAETLYVKDADGKVIAKFGYDGTAMNELDGYEDITFTGANGNLTVNGVAVITLNGVAGTYSVNKEAAYTADAYIGGSYYEVTLDKAAETYTIVKRMVTVTFDTAYDTANAVSGDMNKNIVITLPALTDAAHVFRGWYIEDETELLNGEYTPTANVTLHAKWDIKVTLTVVYGNGLETVTLEYGAGDTAAPAAPAFTDGKAFDCWYLSDDNGVTEKEVYTPGEITENVTIYCKWINAVAMYGNYYGWNLFGTGAKDISKTTTSSTKLIIAADGVVTGTKSGNVLRDSEHEYNSETGVFYVQGTALYYLVYDAASGAIGVAYNASETNFNQDMFLLFNKLIKSGQNSDTLGQGGALTGGKLVTVTFEDDTTVNLFVTSTEIYSGVTWTATNASGEAADYTAKTIGNATTVTVYASDGRVLISRGKDGSTWKDLDGMQGTYTNGADSFTLDGIGNIVWGGKSGTYKAAPEGSDYTYDVTLKNPAEYHQVTVTGKTFTAVKPMATITFDLGGKGTNFTQQQNVNIALALSGIEKPVYSGFVFKGWYPEADGTGTEITSITPASATDAKTVYAKWAQEVKLTVVYGNGLDNAVLIYGAGDTTAPVAPGLTANKLFDYWYLSDDNGATEKAVYTVGAINADTTIYCKWKEPVAMMGSYKGFNYYGSASDKTVSSLSSSFTVSAEGNVVGRASGTAYEITADTFKYGTGSSTRYVAYDAEYGIIAEKYGASATTLGNDFNIYFKGEIASVDASANLTSSGWTGCLTVHYKDGTTMNALVYNDKVYGGVSWNDGVSALDTKNAETLTVKDKNGATIVTITGKVATAG